MFLQDKQHESDIEKLVPICDLITVKAVYFNHCILCMGGDSLRYKLYLMVGGNGSIAVCPFLVFSEKLSNEDLMKT